MITRDTAKPVLSSKIELRQEIEPHKSAGFILFLAVYKQGYLLIDQADRQNALLGYVSIPFRADDLMNNILGKNRPEASKVYVEVFDGLKPITENLLYSNLNESTKENKNRKQQRQHNINLNFNHHDWTLRLTSSEVFEKSIDHQKGQIILIAGLLISLALFAMVRTLALTSIKAQKIAASMTLKLAENKEQLKKALALQSAILYSAGSSIITTDTNGLIVTFNPAAEKMLGYTADEMINRHSA